MKNHPGLPMALAAAAGAIAAAPSGAAPVTLSQTFALSALLQQGASSTLSFDVNSFLSSQGHQAGEVVGGQVTVFGFSEASYGAGQVSADYNATTSANGTHMAWYSYYVSSYCSWWSGCYGGYTAYGYYTVQDYARYADRDILYTDGVADQMRVTAGQTTGTGTASAQASTASGFGAYLYDGVQGCTDVSCSRTYLYHRERNVYQSVAGALDVSLALDAQAVNDIASDGVLDLLVQAPVGHFALQSVRFDLDLLPMVAPATLSPTGGAVPEPGGIALGAVALAAALVAGRRRRATHG